MWTNEQQNAIDARNVSLIVSAAAGSGKTSVLVERLTKLLADDVNRIPANEMIIVTFTNAATAEMKYRLSEKLAELSAKNPENEWLVNQQSLLQCAKISTINSFCFELIRENIQDTDIASGFRIIDEAENKIIIHNCAEDTLEYAYTNMRPIEMEMLYNCFCDKNDKRIEDILIKIYNFMESIPYSDRWLNNVYKNFRSIEFQNELRLKFIDIILKKTKNTMENIELACNTAINEADDSKQCQKAAAFFEAESEELLMKCGKIISFLENSAENIRKNPNAKASKINVSELNFEFATKASTTKYPDEINKLITELRDEYKDTYKNVILPYLNSLNRFDKDILSHAKIMRVLIKLIGIMKDRINEAKTAKNGLSFSDGERIALSLLSYIDDDGIIHKTKLAEELSEYYKIIMIDEFQDSNDNQDIIFKLLSKGGSAYENGSNLFLVGDVKQAIYGFRQSNADIFVRTMKESVEYKQGASENSYIKLNKNFRSSKPVIDFVNYIFSHIMTAETGDVDYGDDEKLIQGASFADTDKATEIALILESDDCENSAAEWTALKIKEMLENQSPVCEKDGSTRPCRYSDFCLLMRNNKNAELYADILKNHGIPVYAEESSGYLQSREISLMINLLKVINNPLSDVPLASVMLSPMFSFTPDEVTEIRLFDEKAKLYTALCHAVGEFGSSEESTEETQPLSEDSPLYAKCKDFLNVIKELRIYSATDTLEQLIRRIYERTDFLSVMQVYNDSERKKANLRVLIEYAKSYENGSFGGLSGFLRYIDRSLDIGSDSFRQGSTSSGSENAVSIKTMHKSKGLEFPFVFICEMEKNFNKNPQDEHIMKLDRKYGTAFRIQNMKKLLKYPTAMYEIMSEEKINTLLSEEMRLMYVALTRAKEKLFIPIKINDTLAKKVNSLATKINLAGGITNSLVKTADSMRDWLIMALIASKYSNKLCEICKAYSSFSYDDEFELKYTDFTVESESEETADESLKNYEEYQPDGENVRRLEESFEFFGTGYDFAYSALPAKLSVSDVSKQHDTFKQPLKRPKFITDSHKLTGAESGTALHTFMQYCDLSRISEYTEDEIDSCTAKGFISQKQRDCINPAKIKNFTNSELFERIMNSDKYMREQKFMINLTDIKSDDIIDEKYTGKDIILQGIADILFIENGNAVLVDYKTDYATSDDYLKDMYSRQLILYKRAFEKILGIPVKECIIYSFSLDRCIQIT